MFKPLGAPTVGRRSIIQTALAASLAAALAAPNPAPAQPREPVLLVLGDSLSAEYGIARNRGWVALMTQRLAEQRHPHRVINASISGETTGGGLSRLPKLLAEHKPAVVVIELGANDALRGFALSTPQANLTAMVRASRSAGARVVLVPMQMPPNYGAPYARDFTAVYAKVAQAQQTTLTPFLLKGLADDADPRRWFQADGLHPLATAQPRMLDNVWPAIEATLKK